MTAMHRELAAGGWQRFGFIEQMANTGSEVERALNWREKSNSDLSRRAFERALELLDLTIADDRNRARLRELTRTREALVDYFAGDNHYGSSDKAWRCYFGAFARAAALAR